MKKLLPTLVWLVFLGLAGEGFVQNHWEGALVVFAALALVPMGLALLDRQQPGWYWLTAAGLCAGYLVFPNPTAALWALPYLLPAMWPAVRELADLLVFKKFELQNWVRAAALAYWATGAAWAVFFLGNIRPLGFDAVIVGLTAAHFHVAGFVLAVVVYCLLSEIPGATSRVLGWGVLAGMPVVAAGITATKLGYSPVFEWAAALGFVALALGVVGQQIKLAFQKNTRLRYGYSGSVAQGACSQAGY
ncbi:MAG: YndJ family transporter [Lewinellaceae bacterium]|nr:YndJ family transporter [Lewinellaceae bacterium]